MSEAQVPTSRRVARETILRILYTMEVGRPVVDEALLETIAAHKLDESAADFVQSVVRDVLANKLDLDATITRHASGYKARELTVVDRNIIRMAITEVRSDISDASQATIVVEAMELARKYSAEEATKFFHGVLGSVFGHKRGAESTAVLTESTVPVGGQVSND
jgi:N utilization substance protein B